MGILEALGYIESVGNKVLDFDELLFVAEFKKKKGCRLVKSKLTQEDIRTILKIGFKCKNFSS